MDFQRKILQDQRAHVLEQFQQVTEKWHEVKRSMQENIVATSQAFDEKDKEAFKIPKELFHRKIICAHICYQDIKHF